MRTHRKKSHYINIMKIRISLGRPSLNFCVTCPTSCVLKNDCWDWASTGDRWCLFRSLERAAPLVARENCWWVCAAESQGSKSKPEGFPGLWPWHYKGRLIGKNMINVGKTIINSPMDWWLISPIYGQMGDGWLVVYWHYTPNNGDGIRNSLWYTRICYMTI